MGCWEETCAITSTPVYAGDPCVMVVLEMAHLKKLLDPGYGAGTIGTIGSLWQWKVVKAIHRGTYNDYGWLNEAPDRDDGLVPAIFFHAEAWDWLAALPEERFGADDEFHEFNDLLVKHTGLTVTPELRQFAVICRHAFTLRRNIFNGLAFRGHQEWVEDSTKDTLLAMQASILARQKRRFAEDDEPEPGVAEGVGTP